LRPGRILFAGAAVLAAALGILWTGQPWRLVEAALLLEDIRAGSAPSLLKRAAPAPARIPVAYRIEGRDGSGDIHEPADGARAGLILVPGATPAGKDDRALVAFAGSLARIGFRVLVPEIPGLRHLRLGSADIRPIADAARFLSARMDYRQPLGLIAVSYATGPALAALAEPGVAERIGFAVAIGGYFDMGPLLAFITTGHDRDGPGQPWRHREVKTPGKWVFLRSNADRLEAPGDAALVAEIARRRLANPDADVADLALGLGPEGKSLLAMIDNRDPDRVPGLIAALPQAVRDELDHIDPSRLPLASFKARFVLIHGLGDPFIPESQSQALARSLHPRQVDLYLPGGLNHVLPRPATAGDLWTLLRAANRVLELRDGR
jgi:hypothetical protein